MGGGYQSDTADLHVPSAGVETPTGYTVIAVNYSQSSRFIQAQAICASGAGLGVGKVEPGARSSEVLEELRSQVAD